MIYRADYADEDQIAVFEADTDDDAIQEALSYEKEYGTLFNVFEVDENYDVIRTVF